MYKQDHREVVTTPGPRRGPVRISNYEDIYYYRFLWLRHPIIATQAHSGSRWHVATKQMKIAFSSKLLAVGT